jgi:hypothetical protein
MSTKLNGGRPLVRIVETDEDSFGVFPAAEIMFDMVIAAGILDDVRIGSSEGDGGPLVIGQRSARLTETALESMRRAQGIVPSASYEGLMEVKEDVNRVAYKIEGDRATLLFRFEADSAMETKLQDRYGYQGIFQDRAICLKNEEVKVGNDKASFSIVYDQQGFVEMKMLRYPRKYETEAMMRMREEIVDIGRAARRDERTYLEAKR